MQLSISGLFLLPLVLLTLFFVMRSAKVKSFTVHQKITVLSFIVYIFSVIYLTFFPFQIQTGMYANQTTWLSRINFDPVLDLSALPNLLMLAPLSVYYYLLKKESTLFKAVGLGFCISFGIEFLQFLTNYFLGGWRGADIADIVVNTMGAALGYLLVKILFSNENSPFFQKFKTYA